MVDAGLMLGFYDKLARDDQKTRTRNALASSGLGKFGQIRKGARAIPPQIEFLEMQESQESPLWLTSGVLPK
jgi:hypothetical protein